MEQKAVTCKCPELEFDVRAEAGDVEAGQRDPGPVSVKCSCSEVSSIKPPLTPRPRPERRTVTSEGPIMLLTRAPVTTRAS